jgi:hypothetical protein
MASTVYIKGAGMRSYRKEPVGDAEHFPARLGAIPYTFRLMPYCPP